jgi:hypothetical protein
LCLGMQHHPVALVTRPTSPRSTPMARALQWRAWLGAERPSHAVKRALSLGHLLGDSATASAGAAVDVGAYTTVGACGLEAVGEGAAAAPALDIAAGRLADGVGP